MRDEVAGPDGGAQTPAGHRELLAERVEDDGPLGHARQGCDRPAPPRVAHVPVGLVGEHVQVVSEGQLGQRGDLLIRALRSGGVVEVVEDEQLGARGDGRLDRVEVEEEVLLAGHEAVGFGDAAEELDLALVDREAGVGVEDFVAGVHEREEELLDHRLAPGLHGDVLGSERETARGADVRGQRSRAARECRRWGSSRSCRRGWRGRPPRRCSPASAGPCLRGGTGRRCVRAPSTRSPRLRRRTPSRSRGGSCARPSGSSLVCSCRSPLKRRRTG